MLEVLIPRSKCQTTNCTTVKVVELYNIASGCVLDDVEATRMTPADVPKDLADRVVELVNKQKPKQEEA